MEHLVGLLKVKVVRGVNLAYRDSTGSDPYVVVRTGTQEVFDNDTFTKDDSMGDAEFTIQPLVEAAKMNLEGIPSTTVIRTVNASTQNCLASDSHIILRDGKLVQDIIVRLRNAESGEVELG